MPLSALNAAQAQANSLRVIRLIDLGALYITDLDRPITVDGNSYVPAKILMAVSPLEDQVDGKARSLSITLSGLDAALRTAYLASRAPFTRLRIRAGFCDASWALVDAPIVLSDALLSHAEASFGEQSGVLTIQAETRAVMLARDAKQLATPQSQSLRFPGDTGLSRVATIATAQISWGAPTTTVGAAVGNPSGSGSRSGGSGRGGGRSQQGGVQR